MKCGSSSRIKPRSATSVRAAIKISNLALATTWSYRRGHLICAAIGTADAGSDANINGRQNQSRLLRKAASKSLLDDVKVITDDRHNIESDYAARCLVFSEELDRERAQPPLLAPIDGLGRHPVTLIGASLDLTHHHTPVTGEHEIDLTGAAPPILREDFVARLFVGTARQRFAMVTEVFAFSAHDRDRTDDH